MPSKRVADDILTAGFHSGRKAAPAESVGCCATVHGRYRCRSVDCNRFVAGVGHAGIFGVRGQDRQGRDDVDQLVWQENVRVS